MCVEMQGQLQQLLHQYDYNYYVINIDGDPELEHRYGARVPVLVAENNELCQYKLDINAVTAYLTSNNL